MIFKLKRAEYRPSKVAISCVNSYPTIRNIFQCYLNSGNLMETIVPFPDSQSPRGAKLKRSRRLTITTLKNGLLMG